MNAKMNTHCNQQSSQNKTQKNKNGGSVYYAIKKFEREFFARANDCFDLINKQHKQLDEENEKMISTIDSFNKNKDKNSDLLTNLSTIIFDLQEHIKEQSRKISMLEEEIYALNKERQVVIEHIHRLEVKNRTMFHSLQFWKKDCGIKAEISEVNQKYKQPQRVSFSLNDE